MINIQIICVGKLKENSMKSLCDEYSKRIGKYAKISIVEVADESNENISSSLLEEKIKQTECDRIKKVLDKNKSCYAIALDLKGATYTSEKLAEHIEKIATYNSSSISFIIGGSLGLTRELVKSCNESICFSTLTFPHGLIRIFLLEQLYRCFKILNNESYHK